MSTARDGGAITATLVSAPTSVRTIPDATVDELLAALRLDPDDLDPLLPIRVAYSGNHHPIVAVTARALDHLDQDHERLRELMARQGWGATVAVVIGLDREFEARNPFPPGGVREDPATGSARRPLAATSASSTWWSPGRPW